MSDHQKKMDSRRDGETMLKMKVDTFWTGVVVLWLVMIVLALIGIREEHRGERFMKEIHEGHSNHQAFIDSMNGGGK